MITPDHLGPAAPTARRVGDRPGAGRLGRRRAQQAQPHPGSGDGDPHHLPVLGEAPRSGEQRHPGQGEARHGPGAAVEAEPGADRGDRRPEQSQAEHDRPAPEPSLAVPVGLVGDEFLDLLHQRGVARLLGNVPQVQHLPVDHPAGGCRPP
ncbi:hypothetical protein ACFFIA_05770 [Phytohabitans kaempferiae]|uniref:Uncharacterized protein n=1 Tax=Phytohabitans kaempferiae TaxID=1620943 RepID=A0ABV6LXN5_9ACTN